MMTQDELQATIEEKLRLVSDLDERIARGRDAERRALVRGACYGVAMFAILGAIPHYIEPVVFELFRYGSCALLGSCEFLVKRARRRRLEAKQEVLMERPMGSRG